MKQWYMFYSQESQKIPQLVGEIHDRITGQQKQIIVAGKTRKLDMLFFHIPLNCYIVVELKAVPFQPEFAGKPNFYVNAVDDLIKTPSQNPTIGLDFVNSSSNIPQIHHFFSAPRNTPTQRGQYQCRRLRYF